MQLVRTWITHCNYCGGDGIDPGVKDSTGKVAAGEYAVPCPTCGGSGHMLMLDDDVELNGEEDA